MAILEGDFNFHHVDMHKTVVHLTYPTRGPVKGAVVWFVQTLNNSKTTQQGELFVLSCVFLTLFFFKNPCFDPQMQCFCGVF